MSVLFVLIVVLAFFTLCCASPDSAVFSCIADCCGVRPHPRMAWF